MFTVTDRAAQVLREILTSHATAPDEALRLAPMAGGGFGLVVDVEREGDEVIQSEGATLLLLDEEVSSALDGVTLDCVDTPQGVRLTLRR